MYRYKFAPADNRELTEYPCTYPRTHAKFRNTVHIKDGDMDHYFMCSLINDEAVTIFEKLIKQTREENKGDIVLGFDCEFNSPRFLKNRGYSEKKITEIRSHTLGKMAKQVVMFIQFASQKMSVIIDLLAVFRNDSQHTPTLPSRVTELLNCNLVGFAIEGDIKAIEDCWPDVFSKTDLLRLDLGAKCKALGTKRCSLKNMARLMFGFDGEEADIPHDWSHVSLSRIRYAGRDACLSKRVYIGIQLAKFNGEIESLRNTFLKDNVKQDIEIRKKMVKRKREPIFRMLINSNSQSCIKAGINIHNLIDSTNSIMGSMHFDKILSDEPVFEPATNMWNITVRVTVYILHYDVLIPVEIYKSACVKKTFDFCTKKQKKIAINAAIEKILNDTPLRNVFKSYNV